MTCKVSRDKGCALLALSAFGAGILTLIAHALLRSLALDALVFPAALLVLGLGLGPLMRAGQTAHYRDNGNDGQWWSS